jgi:glycosyltransferase involved in cell wall biosynthesis
MNEPPCNQLVSIIVPCYNQGNFLAEALESLLAQTYPYWECQIIDDGSTDNTKTVTQEYVEKDSRIKYNYQDNRGLSAARNQGLKIATGEYIQFLDADDLISPQKFETQLAAFKLNPDADIVYSEYLCFDHQDRKKTWTYSRVQLKNNVLLDFIDGWENGLSIPIHCFLYKKNCFERWGLFDESLIYGKEDWDLHLKFALNNAGFNFTSGVMAFYRQGTNSMTKNDKKMEYGKQRLFYKYLLANKTPVRIKMIFIKRRIYDRINSWSLNVYKLKDHLLPKETRRYYFAKFLVNWVKSNILRSKKTVG